MPLTVTDTQPECIAIEANRITEPDLRTDTITIPVKLCNLPPFNGIAAQVLALTSDTDIDMKQLSLLIEGDRIAAVGTISAPPDCPAFDCSGLAIAPGFIETAMTAKISPEAREGLMKQIPLASLGQPDDVASAVLFFASPAARYITGQVLAVDGGMAM